MTHIAFYEAFVACLLLRLAIVFAEEYAILWKNLRARGRRMLMGLITGAIIGPMHPTLPVRSGRCEACSGSALELLQVLQSREAAGVICC
jgi:hypothetical protein